MATIYLDSKTYSEAALYAKINNISIADAFKAGIKTLLSNMKMQKKIAHSDKYYISPKVKSLETGFECPVDMTESYKEELSRALMNKYL